MTHISHKDDIVSCLSGLLVKSCKYRITFNKHVSESVLVDFRKAKVADISKYIDRIDNKMPLTYILEFEDFTGYLVIDLIINYSFTYNSIILEYDTYPLVIEKI